MQKCCKNFGEASRKNTTNVQFNKLERRVLKSQIHQ